MLAGIEFGSKRRLSPFPMVFNAALAGAAANVARAKARISRFISSSSLVHSNSISSLNAERHAENRNTVGPGRLLFVTILQDHFRVLERRIRDCRYVPSGDACPVILELVPEGADE